MSRRAIHAVTLAACTVAVATAAITQDPQSPARRLGEVIERIATQYVDSIPRDSIYVRAARGLLTQLGDPYAQLFSPAELAQFTRSTIGERYGGMGMSIEQHDSATYIVRVFEGSPGAQLGVRAGDRIDAVNGVSMRGQPIDEVTRRITGPVGTTVNVSIYSPRTGATRTLQARRALVHAPAVPYSLMFDRDVGYIPLQLFSGTSAQEVTDAVRSLRAQGAKRFILDLRGNGGGDLDAADAVSGVFLRQGQSIVKVKHRGQPDDSRIARTNGPSLEEPLVVLVDEGTASASEIVAGALQDHDRALVLGTTTFGKGLVQSMWRLPDGWGVKMTTGKWFTPSGRLIQRERRIDENGRFVTVTPDSLETDSVRKTRPAFKSGAGRVVYGGGGITPDVIVAADTLSTPEQILARALAGAGTRLTSALFFTAIRHLNTTTPDFVVPATWGDTLYRALTDRRFQVDRQVFDAGRTVLTRALDRRLASLAFGDSVVVRHTLPNDLQLRQAIGLLKGSPTVAALLAQASGGRRG
jgi:carboxyl-terminal processing protease